MVISLLLTAFLLQGLQETEAFVVTGEEGRSVDIKCVHSNAFTNMKYFCKESCRDEDVLVTSKSDKNRKYRIEDSGNTFHVTVSDLEKTDTGDYRCGIDRVGVDTYNYVTIIVTERTADHGAPGGSIRADTITSKKLLYIGAGLGVVVLILAIVLLIFFRHRKRHARSSQEKDREMVYATPSKQKQDRPVDITATSANEAQEACDGGQIQPEALFYSSVSFSKHADHSSETPPASATTYASIKHRPTDEGTVYSNI